MTVKIIYNDFKQDTYCFIKTIKETENNFLLYFENDNEPLIIDRTDSMQFTMSADPSELTIQFTIEKDSRQLANPLAVGCLFISDKVG